MSTELDLGWLDPSLGALQRQEAGGGSGLCRAVAARMGVDVVLVRVAIALLALSGGLGVALYAWGTVLSRGSSGVRPIDSMLPAFGRWSPMAQKAVVILTSLAAVSLISQVTPLPWGPGVVLMALFVLARRGRLGGGWAPPTPSDRRQEGTVAASDEDLVAHWRSTMQAAAGAGRGPELLPVVDLYAPAPVAAHAPGPRARPAWLAGAGILTVLIATGALVAVLLGSPRLALGLALAAAGALVVVHAVATRRRRVPRPLLAVLVVAMVAAGWLAPRAAAPTAVPPVDSAVMVIEAIGEERVVDLRDSDLSGVEHIRIEVAASDLTVLLPGSPLSVTSGELLSDVNVYGTGAEPLELTVTIDALLSRVTLEETR
ncbi:PspC domain-containing protein [Tessaracoccus sp. Z1128]